MGTTAQPGDGERIRIGVIGDLHTHWDDVDVAQFNASDYDLVIFIGDLGGGTPESSLRVARSIARLDKPTLVIPGNNDTGDLVELAAELSHRDGLQKLDALRMGAAQRTPVRLCGYSLHHLTRDAFDVTLIFGRPHSLGGGDLSFPEHMTDSYDVPTLEHSTQRLCALVDESPSEHLVFFAHNGPTGLGAEPHDMWGCDFKPGGGDWGDPDLAAAVAHARRAGKRVHAVVAGHMHLRTKQGVERPWLTHRDGIGYVNAARVPRILAAEDNVYRHHVALTITAAGVDAEEVLVPQHAPPAD